MITSVDDDAVQCLYPCSQCGGLQPHRAISSELLPYSGRVTLQCMTHVTGALDG